MSSKMVARSIATIFNVSKQTSKLIVNISCNSNESDVIEVDMTVDDEVLQAELES